MWGVLQAKHVLGTQRVARTVCHLQALVHENFISPVPLLRKIDGKDDDLSRFCDASRVEGSAGCDGYRFNLGYGDETGIPRSADGDGSGLVERRAYSVREAGRGAIVAPPVATSAIAIRFSVVGVGVYRLRTRSEGERTRWSIQQRQCKAM